MSNMKDLLDLLEKQGEVLLQFRAQYDEKLANLSEAVTAKMAAAQRPAIFGGGQYTSGEEKALGDALRALLRGDEGRELKGMTVGTDPAGGYLVLPQFSEGLSRIEFDTSPIRRIARIVSIEQADAFEEVLDKDSAAATWVGEQGTRSATAAPQLTKLRIPVHEIYAAPQATQSLIDDSKINIVAWLTEKVGQQFGVAEGAAFVSGDGVGKPRGFLSYPTAATADGTRPWGTLEHVATGTSGGFGTDPNGAAKLIDLVHRVKAGYRSEATWLMNKKTVGEVRKLKDTAGRFVWADSIAPGQPALLLGYPVVEAEDLPDIAANSLSIAFGNFRRGYTVVDRIGLRLLVDPYSAKPHVIVYCYRRVGGDVTDFNAIKLLKFI